MAAKSSGDSKQGLIITLVMFVLLSIILAVTTYMGYSEQEKYTKAAKDAADATAAMKKGKDWEQFKALLFKSFAGQESGSDLSDFANLWTTYDLTGDAAADKDKLEIQAAYKRMVADLGWDANNKRPVQGYARLTATQRKLLENAATEKEKFLAAAKNAKEEYDSIIAAREEELKKVKESLALAQKQNVDLQQAKAKSYMDSLAQLDRQEKDIEGLKNQNATTQDMAKKKEKRLQEDIEGQAKQIVKLQAKNPPADHLANDQPKGKIVSLDQDGKTAYINLGSSDNVKPLLTFSVVGADPRGQSTRQVKGQMQVAAVLGEHLSQARLTSVRNANVNPILTGDLLFNPVWNPTIHEHVAIAGLIDITGDGRDDTKEFIRELQKQGIVIDAYLDLKDLTIKGKGISYQTDYLILGETPDFNARDLRGTDVRSDRKNQIHDLYTKMSQEAKAQGVTIVPLRKFVNLIGYKLPTGAASSANTEFNLLRIQTKPEGETPPADATPPAKKDDEPKEK